MAIDLRPLKGSDCRMDVKLIFFFLCRIWNATLQQLKHRARPVAHYSQAMNGSLILVVLVFGIEYASGFLAPSVMGGLEGRGDSEVWVGRARCGLFQGCFVHNSEVRVGTARCGLEEVNMNECNGMYRIV
jgi:hypothetical protein